MVSLLGLCVLASFPAWSEAPSEYALKAEFIERFTRFVDWPSDGNGTFKIGIVGEDPFGPYLRRLADSRRIKDRRVELRRIDDMDEVTGCQVVFIADSEKSRLEEILTQTHARPILTVADSPGFAEAGVLINFYLDGDRIRFEINEPAVSASGLQVDSKLLKLARVIDGVER